LAIVYKRKQTCPCFDLGW